MNLLDNDKLQEMVDYSFGDQSGVLGGVPQAYMKKANESNYEFKEFMFGKWSGKKPVTLFIDNIRLYRRPIEYSDWLHMKHISPEDRQWLNQFEDEDLLKLCTVYPQINFIIFTAFEDTPLDNHIWAKIPENVLAIHAANGVVFGEKIHPFPHGLERKMNHEHNHQAILRSFLDEEMEASKLLYVNHRDDTGNRKSLKSLFSMNPWATVSPRLDYSSYLSEIKKHMFVLCPSGNGIESARNWETLYMRRVPVFKDHPYLREMFKDFPCLFVKEFEDVTEKLLLKNAHLYLEAQKTDMDLLDLKKIYDLRLLHI